MSESKGPKEGAYIMEKGGLARLFETLAREGFALTGPTARDGAIVYDDITSIDDLPSGFTDRQEAGTYRLEKNGFNTLFGYNLGPFSWKKFLFPPRLGLWKARRNGVSFEVTESDDKPVKRALIGVRPCEIAAISVQDKVLLAGGEFADPHYRARRENVFIMAVNCAKAGGTCFCVSMGTGPRAEGGFDITLTEILDVAGHRFLAEAGSETGGRVLSAANPQTASAEDIRAAEAVIEKTARSMGRSFNADGLKDILYKSHDHPRWDDAGKRCLTCANCTMVCPTCFCSTVEDVTDLSCENTERVRRWDSCFAMDFTYIHGGSVRPSAKARYRHWLIHKLAAWIDQFGTSGCVGCGRCITWCPAAIDITEEARAIRGGPVEDKAT